MSHEENILKSNANMFLKKCQNIDASVFCISVNVMVKHNKRLN